MPKRHLVPMPKICATFCKPSKATIFQAMQYGGDEPTKQIELVPGATADAQKFLKGKADTQARFNRVADLVYGFETPLGLELLATVHWVVTRESAATTRQVVADTYSWSERKRRFSEGQIALALDVLAKKGWIPKSEPAEQVGGTRLTKA